MGKFTPLFTKDGDLYVVPSTALIFEDECAAVDGGASAGLASGYGLVANGEAVALLENNDYPGPFLIASVGNIRAWIVGGPTLDKLITDRNAEVVGLPEEDEKPELVDLGQIVTDGAGRLVAEGDHTGPDGQ